MTPGWPLVAFDLSSQPYVGNVWNVFFFWIHERRMHLLFIQFNSSFKFNSLYATILIYAKSSYFPKSHCFLLSSYDILVDLQILHAIKNVKCCYFFQTTRGPAKYMYVFSLLSFLLAKSNTRNQFDMLSFVSQCDVFLDKRIIWFFGSYW